MHCELIHKFEQTDEDTYTLVWVDEDGDKHSLTMDGMDAIRLHNLADKTVGRYAAEYNAAKASYDRGEGPNGEPKGTWEEDEDTHSVDWRHMVDLSYKAMRENR